MLASFNGVVDTVHDTGCVGSRFKPGFGNATLRVANFFACTMSSSCELESSFGLALELEPSSSFTKPKFSS